MIKPSGTFSVKVIPNAKENSITFENGTYRVRIAAPARKNKANRELERFLSKWLGRKVKIRKGATASVKLIG